MEINVKNILISDAVDDILVNILKTEGNFNVDLRAGIKKEELISIIPNYECLIVRSGTKVTADIIKAGTNLQLIGRAGTGVDNVDVEAASRRGIIVMNTPGGNTTSAAEQTMALLLALCRNIPQAHATMKAGKWDRKNFMGTELQGKTIAILGLGRIGREVAIRCQAFGMTTIGYDPIVSKQAASQYHVELLSLDEIYPRADFITIHTPLINETKGLLNDTTLAKCKNGVRIINCARGGIIDEKALLRALDSGKVAGAALDVFEEEPPDMNSAFIKHPKLVCTPHLGASTEEAQEKVSKEIAFQIITAVKTGKILGAVNAPMLAIKKELIPFAVLAEKIGVFVAEILNGHLKKVTITTLSPLLNECSATFRAAVLKGILSHFTNEPVNYINAPLVAKELGLQVTVEENINSDEDFSRLITVTYESDQEKHSVRGTVFQSKNIKIVSIDDYEMEFAPDGTFLYYQNYDKPGVLASVSKELAAKNINIGSLALGRRKIKDSNGYMALTLVAVDDPIPQETVDAIRNLPGVLLAKAIKI